MGSAGGARTADPVGQILREQGFLILDGGLATELETRGCDLNDDLWSAVALLETPDTVTAVHRAYLEAGADCIATATYQATFEGLAQRGLDTSAAGSLMERAVELAADARDAFWDDRAHRRDRCEPLVAASVGPYGAYLADGSEYRGDYGRTAAELYDFHAARWETLAESRADIMACETTPSIEETHAYCRLSAVAARPTWISFQCRDEAHIADGTPLADAVAVCHDQPYVVAVGINCTDPAHIDGLIGAARAGTDKPVLVYPNAGEEWDADAKRWVGATSPVDWGATAHEWWSLGAQAIGGCCRVGPAEIAEIRERLTRTAASDPDGRGV